MSTEVARLRELNNDALEHARANQSRAAYATFMDADDTYQAMNPSDPEATMAGADTLRDWAMTYAREASQTHNPQDQRLLFDVADYVIDRAHRRAEPLVVGPSTQYAKKRQVVRGLDTYDVTTSVQSRINTLRKASTDEQAWGDERAYGRAYAGLKRRGSYWTVTAAAQPMRYIVAKPDRNENVLTSKSTLLHIAPWAGRTAVSLARTVGVAAKRPWNPEARRDVSQSFMHVAMILKTSRKGVDARNSIMMRP